jgi:hypothetical protein
MDVAAVHECRRMLTAYVSYRRHQRQLLEKGSIARRRLRVGAALRAWHAIALAARRKALMWHVATDAHRLRLLSACLKRACGMCCVM